MFLSKDVKKKKKRVNLAKLMVLNLALAICSASSVTASAAETSGGGDMASIVSEGAGVVTTTLGTLWTFITGNAYLSFSVSVSAIVAVIMVFKRLVGAARR